MESNTQIKTLLGVTDISGFDNMLTVSEALEIAGANWEVNKYPIYDGFMQPIRGYSRIVRSDKPDSTMHVCKTSYEPINNKDVFSILDDVLGASQAQIERVGCIKGGKVVFMQAKMPESIEVLKGDNMDCYINAITSHDGTYLAKIFFSATRIACQNQIRALSVKGRRYRNISIRHTCNAQIKIAQAGTILMDGSREWQTIKENAAILARKSVNREQTKAFVEKLFPKPLDTKKRDFNFNKRAKVMELVESGKGTDIQGVRGTAWGLLNATTEYFDHHSSVKGDTSRYARSLIEGDKFRDKAFEAAMMV